MKSLEQMKKKEFDYIKKINKIENDVKRMRALGDSEDHWLVKANRKWLKSANYCLVELQEKIKLEEMKQK